MLICELIKNQDTYQAELGHTVLETVRAMVERNIGAVPLAVKSTSALRSSNGTWAIFEGAANHNRVVMVGARGVAPTLPN